MNDPLQNKKATLFIHIDVWATNPKTGQSIETLFLMSYQETEARELSFSELEDRCIFLGDNTDALREQIVSILEACGIEVRQVAVTND